MKRSIALTTEERLQNLRAALCESCAAGAEFEPDINRHRQEGNGRTELKPCWGRATEEHWDLTEETPHQVIERFAAQLHRRNLGAINRCRQWLRDWYDIDLSLQETAALLHKADRRALAN